MDTFVRQEIWLGSYITKTQNPTVQRMSNHTVYKGLFIQGEVRLEPVTCKGEKVISPVLISDKDNQFRNIKCSYCLFIIVLCSLLAYSFGINGITVKKCKCYVFFKKKAQLFSKDIPFSFWELAYFKFSASLIYYSQQSLLLQCLV